MRLLRSRKARVAPECGVPAPLCVGSNAEVIQLQQRQVELYECKSDFFERAATRLGAELEQVKAEARKAHKALAAKDEILATRDKALAEAIAARDEALAAQAQALAARDEAEAACDDALAKACVARNDKAVLLTELKDMITCSISQAIPQNPVMIETGQVYDVWHITKWFERERTCPNTKRGISYFRNPIQSPVLDKLVELIKQTDD